jgi:plasmid rolling circle replication initiator protein Rep
MGIFDPNFDHYPVIFEIDSYYQRQKTEIYKRKESPASWKKFHKILKDIDIMGQMPNHKDGLTNQELINAISTYIVQILINAYEKATPLVKSKPPPIGGFLTRTTQ